MDANPATERATEKANRARKSHTGAILHHVGTVGDTRDMDVLRAAPGDPKLNSWAPPTAPGSAPSTPPGSRSASHRPPPLRLREAVRQPLPGDAAAAGRVTQPMVA
jgi:hypothetical protein